MCLKFRHIDRATVCPGMQEAADFPAFQSGPEVAAGCFPQSCRLLWNVPVSLLCGCPGWDWPLKMKNNNPPWWFAWLKKVTVCGEPPGCGQQWVTVVRHGRHVANPLPPSWLWMLKSCLACTWKQDCCVYEHVHVHVTTARGARFVLSVCAYCFFSLSLQSKTAPFTYSAHCNPSVRFIPVRLNGVSGMSFIVNQICGNKLLGNCHNNQCIVACMDVYRQVTNFTDILCPFCIVYEVLNVWGGSVLPWLFLLQ